MEMKKIFYFEFSVITDKLQGWDRDQQRQFISKLHHCHDWISFRYGNYS
jgi:hypothetical protein